jgi:hypothetical protein
LLARRVCPKRAVSQVVTRGQVPAIWRLSFSHFSFFSWALAAALTKEKGQRRLLHKQQVLMDSEDAEEYTENATARRLSMKGSGLVSESEDAEESRVEVSYRPSMAATEESAEEYSYIGGGGGWSRSLDTNVLIDRTTNKETDKSDKSSITPREDFASEEISISESLLHEFKTSSTKATSRRYGKEFEESTDAESASESELPFKDDDKIQTK